MTLLDYFRAELLRFRSWAIAFALLHLVVLGFLTRVVDLAQQPRFVYQVFAAVYALAGLLLGAYQMGNYRKPNAWLNLLHRPIPHKQLAAALMLAAATLLALGILLPALVTCAWQEGMTARVLDHRHLLLVASAWLVSVCGYLVGAYALLANRRYAIAGFVFLLGLCLGSAVGAKVLLVQLAVIAWLAAMVLVSFKPDLAAPPRSLAGTLLVAAPLQMAMWFALVMVGFGIELAWIMQGTHPNNLPVQVPGSAKEADNATERERMALGLAASRHPDAPLWREQAAISDIHGVGPSLDELPVRNELTNVAPMEFDDDTRRLRWVFSHDDMRFHGVTLAEQRAAGTLGIEGDQPFPEPPLPAGNGMLATRGAMYQYDEEAGRIVPRARVPGGEHIVGFGEAGERLALLSDRALYLYDARDLQTHEALLQPRLRVPTPGRVGMLARVDMMELLDGVLVSFTYTRGVYRGDGVPYQALVRVDEQGHATEVARRTLGSGYGPAFMYRNWYASPFLFTLQREALRAFAGFRPEYDTARPPVPALPRAIALVLLALSLLLALWRTRRLELSTGARLAWIACCAVVGLPAVLALWLLYPPRERLDDLPVAAPLPA
jgi:hypothetical protein